MYFIPDCHTEDAWIILGNAYVQTNETLWLFNSRPEVACSLLLLVLKIPGLARYFYFLEWSIKLAHGERKRLEYFNPINF